MGKVSLLVASVFDSSRFTFSFITLASTDGVRIHEPVTARFPAWPPIFRVQRIHSDLTCRPLARVRLWWEISVISSFTDDRGRRTFLPNAQLGELNRVHSDKIVQRSLARRKGSSLSMRSPLNNENEGVGR